MCPVRRGEIIEFVSTGGIDEPKESSATDEEFAAARSPFRPRDPVFPSLEAGGSEPQGEEAQESGRVTTYELPGVLAITNGHFTGAEFEGPEAERLQGIVETFVRGHVRRLEKGFYLRRDSQHLKVGSLLVSQDPVPKSRLRHTRFQWGITDGKVMELRRARFPVSHLAEPQPESDRDNPDGFPADASGLALCVSRFLQLLGVVPSPALGVIGNVKFNTNAVGTVTELDALLEEADGDRLTQVIIPAHESKISGLHGDVRYWVATDVPVALFSSLGALSGGVVIPNLVRRAFTKAAYAWGSLLSILAATGAYQLAVALNAGGSPPVSLERVLLYVVAALAAGSLFLTHRFWRLDR